MTDISSSEINFDCIQESQIDMQNGYKNGSIGVIVSGSVWLISAAICYVYGQQKGIWALLIGGMMIHPLGILISKLLGFRDSHTKGNKLAPLAMEGTFFMLLCLPIAIGLSLQHPDWFFKGMLLIIGGRYLTFQTLYGNKFFWFLGIALAMVANVLFLTKSSSFSTLLSGAIVELCFGIYLLKFSYR
jgi:hypothetical protein